MQKPKRGRWADDRKYKNYIVSRYTKGRHNHYTETVNVFLNFLTIRFHSDLFYIILYIRVY